MKPSFAILLVFGVVLGCRTAAPPPSSFGPGTKEIVERTRAFDEAFAKRDIRTLDSMLAPEYSFHWIDTVGVGSMHPRPIAPRGKFFAQMFEELVGPTVMSSPVDARRVGDLGLVVSQYRWSGGWGRRNFSQRGFVTDIWVKRGHRWLLLVSYAQLLPG